MKNADSSRLIKHIIVNDFINITVDKELELVSLTWQRQTSSEELKKGFYLAVEAAIMYSCKYWLSDARQLSYLNMTDQHWLVRDLVSLISLTEVKKLAWLVPEDELSLLYSYHIKDKLENEYQHRVTFRTEIFTDGETARLWLLGEV